MTIYEQIQYLSYFKRGSCPSTEGSHVVGPYLRGGISAALWRGAERRVWVIQAIFDTWSFVHFDVGDREDALAVCAWDFTFIPVLIHSTNQRDPFPLHTFLGCKSQGLTLTVA